jgi:hypothetical protein
MAGGSTTITETCYTNLKKLYVYASQEKVDFQTVKSLFGYVTTTCVDVRGVAGFLKLIGSMFNATHFGEDVLMRKLAGNLAAWECPAKEFYMRDLSNKTLLLKKLEHLANMINHTDDPNAMGGGFAVSGLTCAERKVAYMLAGPRKAMYLKNTEHSPFVDVIKKEIMEKGL